MKHTSSRTGASRSSFIQAILLVVFLIVGVIGYRVLKKGAFSSGLNAFVNMDMRDFRPLESMKEERKKALQKSFGGFWVYRTDDSNALVQKDDCLELRDNGIIWQVVHWLIYYPCGDTGSCYHIRYGYLNPFSVAADRKSIVCEVRTLRQVYITDGDTCFGPSQVDELWQTRKDDSLLVMNRRRYQPYRGELSDFFPDGIIDLIDRVQLSECEHGLTVATLLRHRLTECYQRNEASRTCDKEVITEELAEYFKAAFVDEIFSSIPYFPRLPDSVRVPIILKHNGTIELGLSKNQRTSLDHFEARILNELEGWPLPRCDAATSPSLEFTVQLPQP